MDLRRTVLENFDEFQSGGAQKQGTGKYWLPSHRKSPFQHEMRLNGVWERKMYVMWNEKWEWKRKEQR